MRLIDADTLRQKIERWKNDTDKGNLFSDAVEGFAYDEVLCAIDVAPTIDKESLRPTCRFEYASGEEDCYWEECTVCGWGTKDSSYMRFCPNCGAKIEEN
jgi:rubrerythrin